jgi:hypothetical protein
VTPSAIVAWREALGGRKFLMCMGASFVNTLLFTVDVLSEAGYLMTFSGTVAAYLAADVGQRYMERKNDQPVP